VPISRKIRLAMRRASMVRVQAVRRSWWLRTTRPANLFQPYNDTWENRYPQVFRWLREEIEDGAGTRVLSFGCSVGDEVFSLRKYFPKATLVGLDISRGNISECHRRCRQDGDERMQFFRIGTVAHQPDECYDAILCMAVFRHGDLAVTRATSCAHRIAFEAFDATVKELTRCLKVGGYLVIEHSNFRLCDSASASRFHVALSREPSASDETTPRFGRDNVLLADQGYNEIIFRKER
jgi:2-polyprenyl-3-methyl-5-hydroxy-6-metoxy-1,4-benzoquinol methylase